MKKIIIMLLLALSPLSMMAQRGFHFGSEFIAFTVADTADRFVQMDEKQASDSRQETLSRMSQLKAKALSTNCFLIPSNKQSIDAVGYTSYMYTDNHGGKTYVLPRIIASVKPGTDIATLIQRYPSVTLAEQNEDIVKLDCAVPSSEMVWDLVASIGKLDGIAWCEPDMLQEIQMCNTLYNQQYYLKNTGQTGGLAGVDINVEPIWEITNGSGVTVAVIDVGVDRNHEDMGGRVLEGYTVGNPAGKGAPQNTNEYSNKAHGMACAGIIAAENNSIGIRGVASKANILPININPNYAIDNLNHNFSSSDGIATAIRWAYPRAEVLSNSWGGGPYSNNIAAAIAEARTIGRNGKGCIVVFSAGNDGEYPHVDAKFPGNLDGVITVGAIDKYGTILNYSQKGPSLDLVAPSGPIPGDIVTTDRMGSLGYTWGNYTYTFNGTSASCPEVAGVAALMLSVNSDLTEEQVRTTLQQTARDLGPTGFDYAYGYGLLNATAAVLSVYCKIEGSTYVPSREVYTVNGLPENYTVHWKVRGSSKYGLNIGKPSANQCTVVRIGDPPIAATLYAYILYGTDTVAVLNKRIYTKSKFVGTYEQEACYYYKSHPAIPRKNLPVGDAVFVHQGCLVTIKSEMLEGVTLTHNGVTPEVWCQGKDQLTFSFPLGSGGIPLNINGKNGKLCEDFKLLFFSVTDNGNLSNGSLRVVSTGKQYDISIIGAESTTIRNVASAQLAKHKQTDTWTLEVYELRTGNKMLGASVSGTSYNLDATCWTPGVYVIHAVAGENVYAQKIKVE